MPDITRAEITAVRFFKDEVHEHLAAKRFGKAPGFRLADPHEGRFENKTAVHPEVQSKLHRFDRVVPAIGVAGIIGFAHAAKNMFEAAPVGNSSGKRQEQEIAPRNESIRKPRGTGFNLHVMRERCLRDFPQSLDANDVILAEAAAPCGKIAANGLEDDLALAEFGFVPLAIIEADRFNERMAFERQGKTCCRVLAAGE
jgi:hypothetical protein